MIFKFKSTPIHYATFGKGPAVVLLHGFLESSYMWQGIIPELSKDRTVITIDLPGLGRSGVISEVHSMELMAEVVHKLLNSLGIHTATFVGHSMGGYITLAYAELFPDEVETMVLLNSTSTSDSKERRENRDRALKILDQNPRAFISMAIANWAGADSRKKFSDEIEKYKDQAYNFPSQGIKAAIRGMRDRKDRTQILCEFPKKKFMLLGEEDPIIPLDENLKLAKKCGVESKVVPGGHLSILESFHSVQQFVHFIC